LKTPARIYFKDESASPTGSHKANTAVAQAYYNKAEGVKTLTTETGAGQWGSALSFSCNMFDLRCRVYMVRVSYEQKPYRKVMMRLWNAEIFPSPSKNTAAGRAILEKDPDTPGSLGIAISEAVEEAVQSEDARYTLGSVLHHVLHHQTIVGLETKKQLKLAGEGTPDVIVGCVGGGSNFAGMASPFVKEKHDGKDIDFVAVEPTACPTLTRGKYAYDFGDTACMTPLVKMFTLGHNFIPSPIHAGGLRYHGMAPLISYMNYKGIIDARAYHQREVFDASVMFANSEGIIPAPETSHAVKACIDEAVRAREENKEKVIVLMFSGHGFFDLSSYEKYLADGLEDYALKQEDLDKFLEEVE